MDDYDTFSYSKDQDDSIYEPVFEEKTPPIPPRNLPRVPTRKLPPFLDVPQEPDDSYEVFTELNQEPDDSYEVFTELNQPPNIPKLPRRNSPSFQELRRYSPTLREVPKRITQSMPDVPKRAQPPIPPSIADDGETHLPCVPISQRCPLPIPDAPFRTLPRLPATVPPPPPEETLELCYEDMESYDNKRDLPPNPDKKGSRGPQIDFGEKFKRIIPDDDFDMTNALLNSARDKLKKTDSRPQIETPKTQFPFKTSPLKTPIRQDITPKTPIRQDIIPKTPIRPEVPAKMPVPPLKPTVQQKPQLPVKPFVNKPAKKNVPNLSEKISTLIIDTPDRKTAPPPVKVSPVSNFSPKNTAPPVRIFTPKKTEEDSNNEYDSQDEYIDASEVLTLHYQPYYYETFDSSMERKIFHEDTEDGTFVIRKSRTYKIGSSHPYTLIVFYKLRSYRLRIRLENDEYAIGEKKDGENRFCSVMDLVEHYKKIPLMLIGAGQTTLKAPTEEL